MATATLPPTASGTPTPTPTPTPGPTTEFIFTPPPHYHVQEGVTLNFTVTATAGGSRVPVTGSGLPATASFDGTNFSWVGEFEDIVDNGRHDMTFSAAGGTADVTIGTTEYELLGFDLYAVAPITLLVDPLPIPTGGQNQVLAQGLFDNPDGGPSSPLAGRGTNAWGKFIWSIDDPSVAKFTSATNVAVIDGLSGGTTQVQARFTDAIKGEMAAFGMLEVLDVVSIALDPRDLEFPEGSTEVLEATATLDGASQTQTIEFDWSSSDDSIATVTGGSLSFGTAHVGNVTGQAQGPATITVSTTVGPLVVGSAPVTLVAPLRNQLLFGMDQQPLSNQVVSLDALGESQLLTAMLPPYDDRFGSSGSVDSRTDNEILVAGFDLVTGFSEIQRISPAGTASVVFTSNSTTGQGDTIDVQAVRYRPDGVAYFAMSEGQHTLSEVNALNQVTAIGQPSLSGSRPEGFGPTAIAPDGNVIVYSAPWSYALRERGQTVGFADLVARFSGGNDNDTFAKVGVSFPQLAAPGGDLHILDPETGELFRFEDKNGDGDHFFIDDTTIPGTKFAEDDPGERILAGQLPSGFDTLRLDPLTGDMITTRIVGNAPQRIQVMRIRDLNADGDVEDEDEQVVVFDAGAPPATDIQDTLLKY